MTPNPRSVRGRRPATLVLLAITCGVLPSCAPATKAPPAPQPTPSLALDPCADQLHEISGLLLEYYVAKRKLPPTLADLKAMAPGRPDLFVCPTSHQPYVYVPGGLALPAEEPIGRLVVYDATPAHNGLRWGITVVEPRGNQPLITRIIAVPNLPDVPSSSQPAAAK